MVAVAGEIVMLEAPETASTPPINASAPAIHVETMAKLEPDAGVEATKTRVMGRTWSATAKPNEAILRMFITNSFYDLIAALLLRRTKRFDGGETAGFRRQHDVGRQSHHIEMIEDFLRRRLDWAARPAIGLRDNQPAGPSRRPRRKWCAPSPNNSCTSSPRNRRTRVYRRPSTPSRAFARSSVNLASASPSSAEAAGLGDEFGIGSEQAIGQMSIVSRRRE